MLKFKTYINNKNKEWITFVHGFGGSSNIWHKQVRDLYKHYNLLFVDLRGHGKSKSIPLDYDFNLSTVCDDIIKGSRIFKNKKFTFCWYFIWLCIDIKAH